VRFSEVCIERPVLASVMSLVLVLFGIISLSRLPNRELPDVDAPIVSVTTIYPGAAPEVVETSVTQPLEDQVIGIEGVRHVTSSSREQVSQISIEFEISRDVEAAANDVRDRVARARRALPEEAEEPVVAKQDADARPIMWLAMSGDGYTQIQLSKIADRRVKDRLGKLEGVATVLVGGERRYSMRLWIDNEQLRRAPLLDAAVDRQRAAHGAPAHHRRRGGCPRARERRHPFGAGRERRRRVHGEEPRGASHRHGLREPHHRHRER
jgi:multidrug efflux pump